MYKMTPISLKMVEVVVLNENTVKLDFKELLNKEQTDFKELFTDY